MWRSTVEEPWQGFSPAASMEVTMAQLGRTGALVLGVLGLGLTITYALQLSVSVNSACMVGVAAGSCIALVLGPRIHRPPARWPWRLIAGAATVFLCGMLVRPWAAGQQGLAAYVADASTLSGYVMLILALGMMLRSHGSLGRFAVADGIIICLGAALLATMLFVLPAVQIHNRPQLISVVAGLYPLLDVVLLLLLLNLGFSSAVRLPSFRLIAFGMFCLFIGDVGYAWIGSQGKLTGSPLLDLPFMLTYTSFGVAALDPSMIGLSSVTARRVQAWSALRLSLIIPSLLSPCVLALVPAPSLTERILVVATTFGLVIALLSRAISAVRGFARVQEVLREQATHDALTGLPNRTALIEHLQARLGRRRDGADIWLLYVDLDEFKLVNDHWGHETGDLLLREVAQRLAGLSGRRHFIARIGGDEFVVAGQTIDDPGRLADAIQQIIGHPIQLPGMDLVVTSSIGIATATDQRSAEALLRDADTALFRAKADGRNRWTAFHSSMRQTVRARVETELALRHAITHDQLWVAYQPVIDPDTELTIGAEALVRWTHPVRGLVSPAEFIPVAEETGLITEIGIWVMQESLRQLARWRDAEVLPETFSLAVNVSARQIHDPQLPQKIGDALTLHGISPERLTIEITESVMMADTDTAAEMLAGLRSAGLRLSVDDFGTGYSSLSYLSRFPVNEVKIDRSFVARLGDDCGAEAIVKAVVAMAFALGLDVVAEGVETAEQREALRQLQIHRAQGWLWGAAVDGDQFATRHLCGVPVVSVASAGSGNSNAQ
jgi:diguanylate cyclase (GGDEF)-like protein